MKKKIFNASAIKNCHGSRLDKFLQSQMNELSRTRIQSLIYDGCVLINDKATYHASKKIKNNDKIEVNFPFSSTFKASWVVPPFDAIILIHCLNDLPITGLAKNAVPKSNSHT